MAKASLALERLIEDTEQLISERAKQADEARRPDPEVIAALANAGLMKLLVPQEYGGHEVHPAVLIEFIYSEAVLEVGAIQGFLV